MLNQIDFFSRELLLKIVKEFDFSMQYDALMSGPVFKGYNRSALDRARRMIENELKEFNNA